MGSSGNSWNTLSPAPPGQQVQLSGRKERLRKGASAGTQSSILLFVFLVSTKKYSINLKVESYFIWWESLGLRAQETASQ